MGSNVKQCSQCRKLFQSTFGSGVCPECTEEMDRYFNAVKDYLYNHPNANVIDIAKDTGIAEKTVLNFLREGRLSINGAEGVFECDKCGAPITHGRFCSACQSKLEGILGSACRPSAIKSEDKGKNPSPAKMHISFGSK
jgi:hypothetical protein